MAVIFKVAAASVEVVNCATPPLTVAVPREALPLLKVTVPVGVGPAELMVAQLDRIASVSTLENVSVGVIPFGVQAATMMTHAFVIYDGWDEQDTVVGVEVIHAHLLVKRPNDVALYRQRWERLTEMAIAGKEARNFLGGLSAGFSGGHD